MVLLAALVACGGCAMHSSADAWPRDFGTDYFRAGAMLNVTEPVPGDAFLVGGRVSVASEVKGALTAAAGQLSIGGSIGDHLFAAGGEVKLDAIVSGSARVVGGEVAVGPATVVGGALSLTGGRVEFEGEARKSLQATGGTVHINGTVHGDARVRAQEIVIGPDTQISGRLVVYGASEPEIPDSAVISGGVEFHEAAPERIFGQAEEPAHAVAHVLRSLLWLAGVFLAALLFVFVFPQFSLRASEAIGREPLKALAIGFAVLVCMPVFAVLLAITVIGIPLALLLVPLYLLVLFLGWVTTAQFLGQKALIALRSAAPSGSAARFGGLLLALVLMWIVGRIPHLGPWVRLAAVLVGVGAVVGELWSRRDRVLRAAA